MWGSPLKLKIPKEKSCTKTDIPPNKEKEKLLQKFKPDKLNLTGAEAKKVLAVSGQLGRSEVEWVQRWLEQKVRERSYPPQLAGKDSYGQICLFLNPCDSLALLEEIRSEYKKYAPQQKKDDDEYAFLQHLDLGAYHEHLPQPSTASHNSQIPDDDL
jgi:hypothetical protein